MSSGNAYWSGIFSRVNGEALQDAEKRYLLAQGAIPQANQDMWGQLLVAAGFSGSVNDMKKAWVDAGASFFEEASVMWGAANSGGISQDYPAGTFTSNMAVTGLFDISFVTPQPDLDYTIICGGTWANFPHNAHITNKTVNGFTIRSYNGTALASLAVLFQVYRGRSTNLIAHGTVDSAGDVLNGSENYTTALSATGKVDITLNSAQADTDYTMVASDNNAVSRSKASPIQASRTTTFNEVFIKTDGGVLANGQFSFVMVRGTSIGESPYDMHHFESDSSGVVGHEEGLGSFSRVSAGTYNWTFSPVVVGAYSAVACDGADTAYAVGEDISIRTQTVASFRNFSTPTGTTRNEGTMSAIMLTQQ